MFCVKRAIPLLCLCIGMVGNHVHANKQLESYYTERVNIMSNQGTYSAQDKTGTPVILEWQKTNMLSPDFAAAMKRASTLGIHAFTSVEMTFLRAFPEVVGTDVYFKAFEPLFAHGPTNIDWGLVEEKMQSVLAGHFAFDASGLSKEMAQKFAQDTWLFVSVKDAQTNTLFGFITFLIKPEYNHDSVKVTSIAVVPAKQNRGLAKLLMSSIFKIMPEIKRIFLCTRVTNTYALRAYRSWGFTQDHNPVQDPHYTFNLKHWTFMEYQTDQSDTLQKIAGTITQKA